jgi:hypothetical protein
MSAARKDPAWPHLEAEKFERWILFEKAYPTLARYLRSMKLAPPMDHGVVGRVAQRIEAWVMIECICDQLMREHPEVHVVTVHDSLMVAKRHVALVQAIMEEEWASIGLRPAIRAKGRQP